MAKPSEVAEVQRYSACCMIMMDTSTIPPGLDCLVGQNRTLLVVEIKLQLDCRDAAATAESTLGPRPWLSPATH